MNKDKDKKIDKESKRVIENRKKEQIEYVLTNNIQYKKSAGFDKIELLHNALPEIKNPQATPIPCPSGNFLNLSANSLESISTIGSSFKSRFRR